MLLYTMELYSTLKKNELMTFSGKNGWNRKNYVKGRNTDSEKDKYHIFSLNEIIDLGEIH